MNFIAWFNTQKNPWLLYNQYMEVEKPDFLYELSNADRETFCQLVFLSEQENSSNGVLP